MKGARLRWQHVGQTPLGPGWRHAPAIIVTRRADLPLPLSATAPTVTLGGQFLAFTARLPAVQPKAWVTTYATASGPSSPWPQVQCRLAGGTQDPWR